MIFENIVAKGEIAQNKQFPFSPTMFSTIINNLTSIYREFSKCLLNIFKAVCCTFVVCGKVLTVVVHKVDSLFGAFGLQLMRQDK